jgi:hypothetical protein
VSDTVESSLTVSSCPRGQRAARAASLIGRLTSNVSPQARQRNSYRGMCQGYDRRSAPDRDTVRCVILDDVVDGEHTPGPERTSLRRATPEDVAAHRRRARYAVALERVPGPRTVGREFAAWSRRPAGRLALPALLLGAMMAVGGATGAYLVPATGEPEAAPAPGPENTATPTATAPGLTTPPSAPPPLVGGTVGPTIAPVTRPADVLRDWAGRMSPRVGVPTVALEAYGYAELVAARMTPACGLKWTTLAAIGKVESNHGSANDATLLADGRALPTITGAALNGTGGTQRIPDTDGGRLDGDATWDRAVGPMQFIPGTWESQAVDADNDGISDPNDVDDAALAAANYLCRGGRNLNDIGDWWAAILTYNDVQPYAQAVYQAANDYGTRSRT